MSSGVNGKYGVNGKATFFAKPGTGNGYRGKVSILLPPVLPEDKNDYILFPVDQESILYAVHNYRPEWKNVNTDGSFNLGFHKLSSRGLFWFPVLCTSLLGWISLQNYLTDGILEIDSNLIENSIRPLALGRKNYLFAGSHDAAKDIAMFYSFFGTCSKNDIDPQKWLTYVMQNINDTKTSELKYLLPQFIDKSHLI